MLKDLKTGLTLWRKISNFKYVVMQITLFAVTSLAAMKLVAPRFCERIKEFSLTVNMESGKVIAILMVFFIIAFSVAMKRIVYEAYHRNKDLFYQLAVSKRAGCICTMLQQHNWYGCACVMLLAVCDSEVVSGWLLIPVYTVLFIISFGLCYNRMDSDGSKRKKRLFRYRTGKRKNRKADIFKTHPILELLKITVCGLYQCRGLMFGKIVLIAFMIYCAKIHMLRGSIFFWTEAFLILLNDGYWRNESSNFQYFSEIGVPVSRYLHVHFLAGAAFNIMIPLLLFYSMTGEMITAAVSFVLLSYLLMFWYLVQVYLYLTIGRDKEAAITLCETGLLIMAVLPPVGIAVMVWLYKRIIQKWGEEICSQ